MSVLHRSDLLRTALSMATFSVWMWLLFSGWIFGGAVHLLLMAAVVLFPWRWLRMPAETASPADVDAARNGRGREPGGVE